MQEFDFRNNSEVNALSEMVEKLSIEEVSAAIAAINEIRKRKKTTVAEDFKNWFDSAFLPILSHFAADTAAKLTIIQDSYGDITATFIHQNGFDITVDQKYMHTIFFTADHISINKLPNSDTFEFTLIFGLPENTDRI